MGQINWTEFLYFFSVLIISITLHEFSHCWANEALGDDTPRQQGRMTLNPLAHLDLMGTIMIFVSAISGFGIGWGKAAQFNPQNFRHPARDITLSALAGPVSNLLQMLAWASLGLLVTPLIANPAVQVLSHLCEYGIFVNAGVAVFNMIPIYPLDGHWVLAFFLPPSWRPFFMHPAWGIVFVALVVVPGLYLAVLYPIIHPARQWLAMATWHITGWPTETVW